MNRRRRTAVPWALSVVLAGILLGGTLLAGLVPGGAATLAQEPPAEAEPPEEPREPALEPLPRVEPRLDAAREEEEEDDSLPVVPTPDPRRRAPIREVLRLECSSDLGYRDVVLFSDGVARIKERLAHEPDEETLHLHDFSPDAYRAYVNRLRLAPRADGGDLTVRAPGGDWVESCRLVVALPGQPREEHELGPFDSLSLPLSHRLAIAREIRQEVRAAAQLSSLPRGYEARRGDVLERRDGALFEVLRETGDGGGLEMKGVEQPLTLYIPKGAVRQEFVRLVSRRP